MNLRDLWDNVVLRDILGYIVPGAVTLYALLLLGAGGVAPALDTQTGLLRPAWLHWFGVYPWLALGFATAAAFALGHLQAWIIDLLEKPIPSWNLGRLALRCLHEAELGEEYAMAAFLRLRHMGREQAKRQPLLLWLSGSNHACTEQAGTAQRQAEDLWRLCDRYTLHHSANAQAMFMGRYYILAVYFSNLGLSAMILGLSVLGTRLVCDAIAWVVTLVIVACLSVALFIDQRHFTCADETCHRMAHAVALALVAVTAFASLWAFVALPRSGTALLALGSGAVMLARSGYFRKRFVECTFPIFYAIVQGEDRSIVGQG